MNEVWNTECELCGKPVPVDEVLPMYDWDVPGDGTEVIKLFVCAECQERET